MPGAEDDKNTNENPNPNPNPNPPGEGGENVNPPSDPGDQSGEGGDSGDDLDYSNAETVRAAMKKLRDENAKHRTKNKELSSKLATMEGTIGKLKQVFGGEDDELSPEEQAQQLTQENQILQTELAIQGLVRDLEIPKEHDKYFRFLLNEKMEALKEGQELDDEDLEDIAAQVKELAGKAGPSSTGLGGNGQGGGNPPPDNSGKGEITVEQFASMNMGERQELFLKDRANYDRLFRAANEKGLIS